MPQTIEAIMKSVEDKVIANEPISPAYYIEACIRINAMLGDLDNQISTLEAEMLNIKAEYVKQDMPSTKAEILSRSRIDYKRLLNLRAFRRQIDDFFMLSKKRAAINEY